MTRAAALRFAIAGLALGGCRGGDRSQSQSDAAHALAVLRARPGSPFAPGVASNFAATTGGLRAQFSASEHVPARVVFPERATAAVHVEDVASGAAVEVSLVGARDVRAQESAGYVIYPGAHPSGATVLHRALPEGTEDFIAFDEHPATPDVAYRIDLGAKARGLRLVSGVLEILDGDGAPRLRAAPPYIVGADGARTDAVLAVEGCAVDTNPAAPWGRPVTAPGAATCTVRVSWPADGVAYPAVLDPRWTTTTSAMVAARQDHTAILLSTGKVLVANGRASSTSTTGLLIAELFDPATATWSATGSMATGLGRWSATATQLNTSSNTTTSGKVLVAGGINGTTSVNTAQLYTVTGTGAGTWTAAANLNVARHLHTATLMPNGNVLVAGGVTNTTILNSAAIYNPSTGTGTWTAVATNMTVARKLHTATLLTSSNSNFNNKVLIVGGVTTGTTSTTSVQLFDTSALTWSTTTALATARDSQTATRLANGNVLVTGGRSNGGPLATTFVFTIPASGTAATWATAGTMTSARWLHSATLLSTAVLSNGPVLVIGGASASGGSPPLATAELWNGTSTWTATAAPPAVIEEQTATLLASGAVLIAGGSADGTNATSTARIYDPSFALTCTTNSQCATGFCVNGVCCDTACNGGCGACNLSGKVGTCSAVTTGTTCRAAVGICDVAETCNGTSLNCPADAFAPATTQCRAPAGECDLAENCTGTSNACPADAKKTSGTACTDDGNACTTDKCDGTNVTCQHAAGNTGAVCRAAVSVCDVAETCTGTSTACPTDTFAPATTQCRAVAGECDLAENCTGTSNACPADGKKPSGTACTDDGNACTTDKCDGTNVACQHAAGNAGTVCRAAVSVCDVAESCTGTSTACPTDTFAPASTQCRAAAGECDVAETCTGTSNACPADAKKPSGTACTDDGNVCTTDKCDGANVACQHAAGNAGTVCRAAAGVCDVAETCTGTSATCPADGFKPVTTVCRASAGVCDPAETCTGTSASCPPDVLSPPTTVCRPAVDMCDVAETCTGTNPTCPADGKKLDGSPCDDGNACTRTDTCQSGTCTGTNPVVCTAQDQCHVAGVCNTSTGVCSTPNAPDPSGAIITPVAASATSELPPLSGFPGRPAHAVIDGSGLASPVPATFSGISALPKHNETAEVPVAALWMSYYVVPTPQAPVSITFDLGSAQTLNSLLVWNYAEVAGVSPTSAGQSFTGRGARDVKLYASASDSNPQTLIQQLTFDRANPNPQGFSSNVAGAAAHQLDYNTAADVYKLASAVSARYVRFEILSNYGDGVGVGLSEVRFGNISFTACNDGNACTQTDICQAGACTGADPVVCAAADQCHTAGTCDTTTGVCPNPRVSDGSACDDGNRCTVGDACKVGVCQPGPATACTGSATYYAPLEDLGTFGTAGTQPSGISDAGEVVGTGFFSNNGGPEAVYPFRFSDTEGMVPVEAPVPGCPYCSNAYGVAINGSGVIAGSGPFTQAPGAAMTAYPSIGGTANAINDPGAFAGLQQAPANGGPPQAFRYTPGVGLLPLGALPGSLFSGSTQAFGIDSGGRVVGTAATVPANAFPIAHAFVFTGAGGMQDLNNLAAPGSGFTVLQGASAVNVAYIVGVGYRSDQTLHGFRYHQNGSIDDIGTLASLPQPASSSANALNARGDVVGSSSGGSSTRAVMYTNEGQLHDLNDYVDPASGWTLEVANGINSHSEIVGYGTHAGQPRHAFKIKIPDPTPCPPPSASCLAAGTRDPATGACTYPPLPNGTACDDGNACTARDTCQAGVCTGAIPTVCAPSDQCHTVGTCDPATGFCSSSRVADGVACDDGNRCTTGDACHAGVCLPGSVNACPAAGQAKYLTVVDLGSAQGWSFASGINNQGAVVGTDTLQTNGIHGGSVPGGRAFRWTEAEGMVYLPSVWSTSFANDINESGVICGAGGALPFRYDPSVDSLPQVQSRPGNGYRINDAGTLTGDFYGTTGHYMFRLNTGALEALPWAPDPSPTNIAAGLAIDATGTRVVGQQLRSDGNWHAVRYMDGRNTEWLDDLLPSGSNWILYTGDQVTPRNIVGWGYHDGIGRAYRITTALDGNVVDITDLGMPATYAQNAPNVVWASDINASGEIVGSVFDAWPFWPQVPFVYTDATGIIDLNTLIDPQSGWSLAAGFAINDNHEVVGYGYNGGFDNNHLRAYKLKLPDLSPCAAPDSCQLAARRDLLTGLCPNPVSKADGTACDDGNACTQGDTCHAGVCNGATPVSCAAPDGCHGAGTCNAAAPSAGPPSTQDLIGWWKLDGDGKDASGGGHDLTIEGNVVPAPGRIGLGMKFDGTSGCLSIPIWDAARMQGATGFTMMAWVRTADDFVCPDIPTIMGKGLDYSTAVQCETANAPNGPDITGMLRVVGDSQWGYPGGYGNAPRGAWTLVTTTFDGQTIRLYGNGKYMGPYAHPGVVLDGDPTFNIGCMNTFDVFSTPREERFFQGTIDEAMLYRRPLSDAEIAAYYAAADPCVHPNSPDGTPCNDGNLCTQNDVCQAGACAGGAPVTCSPPDQCHTIAACVPATGCPALVAKADGTPCDDGNACTRTDACEAGACVGANPIACVAPDRCHTASCDPETGACSITAGAGTCDLGAFDYDKAGRLIRDRTAKLQYDAYDQLREVGPIAVPPAITNLPVEDLEVPGETQAIPGHLNTNAHVAVGATLASGVSHAILFTGQGPPEDINAAAGISTSLFPSSVNDADAITGTMVAADATYHAFRYDQAGFRDLGNAGAATFAFDINDAGQIAGYFTVGPNAHGYRYADGFGFQEIGTLGGASSWAWNVDELGAVAASAQVADSPSTGEARFGHAALYQDLVGLQDLNARVDPMLGVTLVIANEHRGDWVVGTEMAGDQQHAYRLKLSTGALDQIAWAGMTNGVAVNDAGDVVGWGYTDAGNTQQAAFIVSDRTGFVKLNDLIDPTSGWDLRVPEGIDDFGDVVGWGYHNGRVSAFRLRIPAHSSGTGGPAVAEVHTYGFDGLRTSTTTALGTANAKDQFWFEQDYTEHDGIREHYVRVGDRIVAKVTLRPPGSGGSGGMGLVRDSRHPPVDLGDALARLLLALLLAAGLATTAAGFVGRKRRPAWVAATAGPVALCFLASCEMLGENRRSAQTLWERVEVVYFHHGIAAGPVLTTNADGTLREERRYEPFGQPIDANVGGTIGPVDFRREQQNSLGKMTNPNTGWSYHGARWMQPQTARWTAPDPALRGPSAALALTPWKLNPYIYVLQNPTALMDPNGRYEVNGPLSAIGRFFNPMLESHEDLMERAWSSKLSPQALKLAKEGLEEQDAMKHQGGSPDQEAIHGMMNDVYQTPKDAIMRNQQLVDSRIQRIVDRIMRGDPREALKELGKASHNVTDSTAAAHRVNGIPQVWKPDIYHLVDLGKHIWKDLQEQQGSETAHQGVLENNRLLDRVHTEFWKAADDAGMSVRDAQDLWDDVAQYGATDSSGSSSSGSPSSNSSSSVPSDTIESWAE